MAGSSQLSPFSIIFSAWEYHNEASKFALVRQARSHADFPRSTWSLDMDMDTIHTQRDRPALAPILAPC